MAGQLEVAVFLLVLITAVRQLNAADEEKTISDGQYASQEPEETAGRGDNAAELCNAFYQLWNKNEYLWTPHSDDSIIQKCKKQKRVTITDADLTLNSSWILENKRETTEYKWIFKKNDSMVRSFEAYGEEVQVLLFLKPDNSCAVVRRELWWFYNADAKDNYMKTKDESWQTCRNGSGGTRRYLCLSRPHHEIVVDDAHKANVPEACKKEYDERRDKGHREDHAQYTEECN